MKTLILFGGPTEGNPFGHAALAFSGQGIYSYGTDTKFGSSTTDYLTSQSKYRDTTLYELNTTTEQENEMMKYIKRNYDKIENYSLFYHSCSTMAVDAMLSANISSNLIMHTITDRGIPAQFPGTIDYLGSILSNGNPVHFPQGAPVSPIIAHYNPGIGVK
ncbi:MAG: DUF4105 domain-containing protein [Bombilactobacillus sp.]